MTQILQTSPLISMIQQQPVSYERMLLVCCIRSYKFYKANRQYICPYNAEKNSWRQDFSLRRFNLTYAVIDTLYRIFDQFTMPDGFHIDQNLLHQTVVDWINSGKIPAEEYNDLNHEITHDFYSLVLDQPTMDAVRGDAFRYWLDLRATGAMIKGLANRSQIEFMTVETIQRHLDLVKGQMASKTTNLVNAGSLLLQSQIYRPRISLPLVGLNRRLAGGLGRDESTMIAGANGGGKTIMAMQLGLHAAACEERVVILTTEQAPAELILRNVSNYCNVPFGQLVERADVPKDIKAGDSVEVSNLPPWLWTDPNYVQKTNSLFQLMSTQICMIDWSAGQGYVVENQFDAEIDAMIAAGWPPTLIIFDWIGGALRRGVADEKINRIYEAAADHLIQFTKKRKIPVVIMAQLDKLAVKGKKAVRMDMLSECKTMTNNISNFLGLSFLSSGDNDKHIESTESRMQQRQYINIDKARKGPGGLVPVDTAFGFQRFVDVVGTVTANNPQATLLPGRA